MAELIMKHKPLGTSGRPAAIVGLDAWGLGRGWNLGPVTENAKAGGLDLDTADLARIRKDVLAPGEPAKM